MSGDHIPNRPEITYAGLDSGPGPVPAEVQSFINLALNETDVALMALGHYGRYGHAASSFKYQAPASVPSVTVPAARQPETAAAEPAAEEEQALKADEDADKLDKTVRAASEIINTLFATRSDRELEFDQASTDALDRDKKYKKILADSRSSQGRHAQADPRGIVADARLYPIRFMLHRLQSFEDQDRVRESA